VDRIHKKCFTQNNRGEASGSRVTHGRYTSLGLKGEAAKDMRSLRVNVDDVGEAISRWFRGCPTKAISLNSAEGGTLFFCFLFHRRKDITVQTMRSKAAPVTPMASAVTFNDFPGFVMSGLVDVSSEELAVAGEGVNKTEESGRGCNVGDCRFVSFSEGSGRGGVLESYLDVVLEQSGDMMVGLGDSGVVPVLAVGRGWKLLLEPFSIIDKELSSLWAGEGDERVLGFVICNGQQIILLPFPPPAIDRILGPAERHQLCHPRRIEEEIAGRGRQS